MEVHIDNLSPGLHGFHIHENAVVDGDCASAGGHYNPFGNQHGAPEAENRHVGALGNVIADDNGTVDTTIEDRLVKLYGEHSVIGRSCLVHGGEDDLGLGGNASSLANGNAGPRIYCGNINEDKTY